MTEVTVLQQADASTERARILKELRARFGTEDRDELQQLSWTDAMSDDDVVRVQDLRTLDFLLDG